MLKKNLKATNISERKKRQSLNILPNFDLQKQTILKVWQRLLSENMVLAALISEIVYIREAFT